MGRRTCLVRNYSEIRRVSNLESGVTVFRRCARLPVITFISGRYRLGIRVFPQVFRGNRNAPAGRRPGGNDLNEVVGFAPKVRVIRGLPCFARPFDTAPLSFSRPYARPGRSEKITEPIPYPRDRAITKNEINIRRWSGYASIGVRATATGAQTRHKSNNGPLTKRNANVIDLR